MIARKRGDDTAGAQSSSPQAYRRKSITMETEVLVTAVEISSSVSQLPASARMRDVSVDDCLIERLYLPSGGGVQDKRIWGTAPGE